ncbi:MAG: serine hydrolase [Rhodospirillales bacterium]|nr:MAG: serine hydrolase [Rhodospirillales bacterium]
MKLARCFALLPVIFVAATAWTTCAGAERPYDVYYLWDDDLDSVQAYRRKVGAILGPTVARNLKVVREEEVYGLIYMRSGGSAGAEMVAKTHTRLLKRAGLNAAIPIRETDWTILDPGQTPAVETPTRPVANSTGWDDREAEIQDVEKAVEDYIAQLRSDGRLAADERTGWSVYDLTTGENLVTINEDVQLQAASLIKPFIAAAFFHKVKNGDFIYGPKSRRHMRRMIQRSNNRSTNWVMRQIGGPAAVQRILQTHYPAVFQDTRIVEYIPAGGRTYRNKASVHDYSRFLYALWNEEIPGAREIRHLMALTGSNRIVSGTNDIPEGTKVYNKTGSTARLCGDMGILIVEGPDGKSYPYIVVGVIEKRHRARNYTAWIRSRGDIIGNVSDIVYRGIARYHAFGDKLAASTR